MSDAIEAKPPPPPAPAQPTTESPPQTPTQPPTPQNKHAWILYFAFLIVASVGVTVLMILFNIWIQLKPEQVDAAKVLWKEKGPRDYKMIYTTRVDKNDVKTIYAVTVKDAKVIEVKKNGKDIEQEKDRDVRTDHSMDALLAMMADNLAKDAEPGATSVYSVGRFDDKTGAVLGYIRRVMGSNERIEIEVHPSWLEGK